MVNQTFLTDGICNIDAQGVSNFWNLEYGNWMATALFAVFVTHLLIAFIKIFEAILNNNKVTETLKYEMAESFLSIFLIFTLSSVISYFCVTPASVFFPVFNDMEPGNDFFDNLIGDRPNVFNENIFDVSIAYTKKMISESRVLIFTTYSISTIINIVANVEYNVTPLGIGTNINPHTIFSGLDFILEHIAFVVLMNMFIFSIQQYMAYFSYYGLLGFYLPLGLVLRCFGPTRLFGGGLIGVSLAFGLIFPLMLNLSFASLLGFRMGIHNDAELRHMNMYFDSNIALQEIEEPINESHGNLEDEIFIDEIRQKKFVDMAKSFASFNPYELIKGVLGLIMSVVLVQSAGITLAGVLLTGITFVVLGSSSIELTQLFGEEIDITNLTRVI